MDMVSFYLNLYWKVYTQLTLYLSDVCERYPRHLHSIRIERAALT